jgi:hypothetical protein
VGGMKRKWGVVWIAAMLLLLTGCLFQPPDDLYQLPEVSADYANLQAAIREVQSALETEYGSSPDVAGILSGDNTATIQLQDLDGDGVRESAITFLRISGADKALKIYIFTQKDEDYQLTGVVEGDGAAIYSVDYVNLNGIGDKELVVCWQISTGVYQVGAYTLDELGHTPTQRTGSLQTDRTNLLATQLLLTSCSAATDGNSVTSGYCLLDFNQDTLTEVAVVRADSSGLSSQVEVYGWEDGAFLSTSSVKLSEGVVSLNRVRSNYLKGEEVYPPAMYVTGTLDDGRRVVDVIAYQKNGGKVQLTNVALDEETGVSRQILQGYTDVGLTDINDDYVAEIPMPTPLPTQGDSGSTNFWLIDWFQYDNNGRQVYVTTTYHNVADGWYLEIPESWRDKLILSRNDQLGAREVVFSLWQGEDQTPLPFLSIYRLTGNNRYNMVNRSNRFILREEESVIYAGRFYDCPWDCGLDETDLLNNFKTIQSSWNGF